MAGPVEKGRKLPPRPAARKIHGEAFLWYGKNGNQLGFKLCHSDIRNHAIGAFSQTGKDYK